ncbi:V-set and transmembrane domain-containing protein 1 [Lagenorhynchus albirostris]|uniref:V-set and transmembrane domain-containing protein 1 n=1 Tax=Lagenorhynchus albirostris TaxID=27610 RepID=UPI0028EE7020|nr:V-set and transmembrane domain-containing protein 1 [Lagenorhynchus albirostris]
MITEFLSLLHLGLCLGNEDENNHEKFSKSLLHALPSSEVEHGSNVTLKCQSDVQNVTFVLGKLQDSGYKQECNSTGQDTKFLLTDLKPKDAGQYFCTYKMVAVEKWELRADTPQYQLWNLQETVTWFQPLLIMVWENMDMDTEVIFVATFCCLFVLLFIAVFFIYRCTRHDSSHEESAKRTSHSKLPEQGAAGVSKLEGTSESPEESQGVIYVKLNTNALSEAASVPTMEPPGSCDYVTLKV